MARFLSQSEANTLAELLDLTMEEVGAQDPRYGKLYAAYNNFEPESNSAASIAEIAAAIALVNKARADDIRKWVFVKIRQTNYPSNWDQPSTVARNQYKAANPGTSLVFWKCPGHGLIAAHDASVNDITIDHVIPVAQHWNLTGHDTDRVTRHTWYWDTTNHAYLCQACNSARGSGGILYNMVTGPNYSN